MRRGVREEEQLHDAEKYRCAVVTRARGQIIWKCPRPPAIAGFLPRRCKVIASACCACRRGSRPRASDWSRRSPVESPHPAVAPKYVVVGESYLFAKTIKGEALDESLRHAVDVTPERYLHEARWNPADHPRGGFPQNRGWFSTTAGGGASDRSSPRPGQDDRGAYPSTSPQSSAGGRGALSQRAIDKLAPDGAASRDRPAPHGYSDLVFRPGDHSQGGSDLVYRPADRRHRAQNFWQPAPGPLRRAGLGPGEYP